MPCSGPHPATSAALGEAPAARRPHPRAFARSPLKVGSTTTTGRGSEDWLLRCLLSETPVGSRTSASRPPIGTLALITRNPAVMRIVIRTLTLAAFGAAVTASAQIAILPKEVVMVNG